MSARRRHQPGLLDYLDAALPVTIDGIEIGRALDDGVAIFAVLQGLGFSSLQTAELIVLGRFTPEALALRSAGLSAITQRRAWNIMQRALEKYS